MQTSEMIEQLAVAIAKAQGQFGHAKKTSVNPFFKKHYADLASVLDVVGPTLSSCGIAVVQSPEIDGQSVRVTTRLIHESGQWIESSLSAVPKDLTPQSIGSVVTYLRRYALQSMVCVAAEDDDGNASSKPRPVDLPKPETHTVEERIEEYRQGVADCESLEQIRALSEEIGRWKATCKFQTQDENALFAKLIEEGKARKEDLELSEMADDRS